MSDSAIDRLLERSVVPSFTSVGPALRRRLLDWRALESYDLSDRVVVLSGGTSGIGEAAARLFAGLGATLEIVARDADKCDALLDELARASGNTRLGRVVADLGRLDRVREAAATLAERHPRIDVLAHNAGALFPERRRTEDGTDLAVELMVSAPFLLTGMLLERLRGGASIDDGSAAGRTADGADGPGSRPTERGADDAERRLARHDGEREDAVPGSPGNDAARSDPARAEPGRVLTMSSGGMYTEGLEVERLEMRDADYRGTAQYARAKRAQVALNEEWAARVPRERIVFHALHPGWVDTPGINQALPGFSRLLSPLGLLRSAREGADTLVWLAADERALESSGDFWLDRERRATHRLERTRASDTPERRSALWRWCERRTGWTMAAR